MTPRQETIYSVFMRKFCVLFYYNLHLSAASPFMSFAVGDTTAIETNAAVMAALKTALDSKQFFGYGPSNGLERTRKAVANLYSPFTTDKKGLTSEVNQHHARYSNYTHTVTLTQNSRIPNAS